MDPKTSFCMFIRNLKVLSKVVSSRELHLNDEFSWATSPVVFGNENMTSVPSKIRCTSASANE